MDFITPIPKPHNPKGYEDVVKKYIKSLDEEGEKKMAIDLMRLYKKHLIEFKVGLKKIYK